MEHINTEKEELRPPKPRPRKKSPQPIDRHINDIKSDGLCCLNAGIDSTCGTKRNNKVETLTDEHVSSSNVPQSTSITTDKPN